jgi:hypothetical protein
MTRPRTRATGEHVIDVTFVDMLSVLYPLFMREIRRLYASFQWNEDKHPDPITLRYILLRFCAIHVAKKSAERADDMRRRIRQGRTVNLMKIRLDEAQVFLADVLEQALAKRVALYRSCLLWEAEHLPHKHGLLAVFRNRDRDIEAISAAFALQMAIEVERYEASVA